MSLSHLCDSLKLFCEFISDTTPFLKHLLYKTVVHFRSITNLFKTPYLTQITQNYLLYAVITYPVWPLFIKSSVCVARHFPANAMRSFPTVFQVSYSERKQKYCDCVRICNWCSSHIAPGCQNSWRKICHSNHCLCRTFERFSQGSVFYLNPKLTTYVVINKKTINMAVFKVQAKYLFRK